MNSQMAKKIKKSFFNEDSGNENIDDLFLN